MKNLACLLVVVLGMTSCSTPPKEQSKPEPAASATTPLDDSVVIPVQPQEDTLKGSLRARAEGKIGDMQVTIRYHSPAVRGRIIWGGLVPFDKVWVAGAHMATSVEFSADVVVDGKSLAAGKYAFFAIPGRDHWTLIINSNWQQHLTDAYDEKQDLLRVSVIPESENANQERLRYAIEAEGSKEGEIVLYWEKLELSLPFQTK